MKMPDGFRLNDELAAFVSRIEKLGGEKQVRLPTNHREAELVTMGMVMAIYEFLEVTETGKMTEIGERVLAMLERKATEQ